MHGDQHQTIDSTPKPSDLLACSFAGLHVPGYSPEQVEEVRLVVRLLPIFFTTILYWTVYAQMGTFFIMQARRAPAAPTYRRLSCSEEAAVF